MGGISFDGGVIKSMRLVKESEALPVRGIVTSKLYLTLKTDHVFEPNAAVSVVTEGMNFSEHFVSRISRKGGLLSIEACDRMRRTENYFDDSLYNECDEPFNASLLLSDLAHQCGFEECENIPGCFKKFYFGDIHGKTCREILNLVAEYAVGSWACKNDNVLRFEPFLSYSSAVGIVKENSSRVYFHSKKGPFEAVYGRNTSNNEVYSAGSSSSFVNILKLSGRLIDSGRVGEVMQAVHGKSFQAFYCDHMDIMAAPNGLTAFILGASGEAFVSSKTEVIFGGCGVYGRARAADICEDESDYRSLTDYEVRKRIEENRQYGSVIMTSKGLGIVPAAAGGDDFREEDVSFFSKTKEGVSVFEGAILDGRLPDKVEKVSEGCRRIVYGGNAFLLKFKKGAAGVRTEFSLEREAEE